MIMKIFVVVILFSFGHANQNGSVELSNEYLTVQFDSSVGQIRSIKSKTRSIQLNNETSILLVESRILNCSKLSNFTQRRDSIRFIFSCFNATQTTKLAVIYTLKSQWKFVVKQIDFANRLNKTISSLTTSLSIENGMNISSVLLVKNKQNLDKQHAVFIRDESTRFSMFFTWQNPFAQYLISPTNETLTSFYSIGIRQSYVSEGFLIGFVDLNEYWHDNGLNYNEREAYENATTFFYPVPQRTRPIKHAVGWDSNDYQIDISTDHGQQEYQRLIDRCAQLGIESITFAPSNTNVSSRDEGTDDWGWESVLWLSLGEQIRLEQWKPFRDPVPRSIQSLIDYAQSKNVKLVPYIYPPLGYRAKGLDQFWLFNSSHCRGLCASLASPVFQQYFLQLLIDFAQVTGITGYAWDYNFFYDSSNTEYSQWWGWQWIRTQLLKTLPYLIMDHRYASQYDGPWSWITLNGYTSPLLSDENPETYPILYPSLHTDKISADFMRQGNVELRLDHFAAMDAIPGFIGHQNERFTSTGDVPWVDHDTRDFDLLGFPYSLLSNIATAGLNLIHTSLPARDIDEFHLLPEDLIEFWTYWLNWSNEHIEEIRNAIPFNSENDWSLMKANGVDGFLFLFNTNYFQVNRKVRLDGKLKLKSPNGKGYWLLKEIYPETKFIQQIEFNQTIDILLDGQSVTAFQLTFITSIDEPILLGVQGQATLANEDRLVIEGVYGEAGTTPDHPIVVLLPVQQTIVDVFLNGNSIEFEQFDDLILITEPIRFPGLYFPRSAPILNNTIMVSDLLLTQLNNRLISYPIRWTDEELNAATWLGPHRLLVFISILEPNDQWNVTAMLNHVPIPVHRAYNTRDHVDSGRFMGFYLDLTQIVTEPNLSFELTLNLPTLQPGQYQGLFIENIERILVEAQRLSSSGIRVPLK